MALVPDSSLNVQQLTVVNLQARVLGGYHWGDISSVPVPVHFCIHTHTLTSKYIQRPYKPSACGLRLTIQKYVLRALGSSVFLWVGARQLVRRRAS